MGIIKGSHFYFSSKMSVFKTAAPREFVSKMTMLKILTPSGRSQ